MTNTPGDDDPRPQEPGYPSEPTAGSGGQYQSQPPPPPAPPYGQAMPPGIQPGMQQGYPPAFPAGAPLQYAPDHPRATTSLVLGILGVVLCQILAPFAWSIGKRTLKEIDASQGRVGGRGAAQAGYVLGIVGTVLLAVGLLVMVVYVIFMVAVIGGGIATSSSVEF